MNRHIRNAVAWWLERAAERRSDHGHRIHRWAEVNDRKIGGAASEIDWPTRERFNGELDAASALRKAAEYLRGSIYRGRIE
jgi:hypothetical protein